MSYWYLPSYAPLTKQRPFTFKEYFDFQTKLARWKGVGLEGLDRTKKIDFIENKSEEDNDHALEFAVVGDKCTEVSEDTSL